MRRERKSAPDAMNAGAGETGPLGHGARGPMGGIGGLGVQRQREHALHILIAPLAWGAWAVLVQQAVDTAVQKTLPPLPSRVQRGGHLRSDGSVAEPIGGQQNNPRPQGESLGGGPPPTPRKQLLPFPL